MASRSETLASLKGQRVRVPDLQALLQDWPRQTSPHLERLQKDVDAKLEELMPAGKRLQQMKKANLARFTATWWPQAEYERLKYIAYFAIWLFNWDDETDSSEFSNMAGHLDAERRFRQDTLEFMRECLSPVPVEVSESNELGERPIGSGEVMTSESLLPAPAVASSDVSPSPSEGTDTESLSPRSYATTTDMTLSPEPDLTRKMSVAMSSSKSSQSTEETANDVSPNRLPRSPLISSFKTVAEGICPYLSPYEHRIVLEECEKFVNATGIEQTLRVKGVLSSLEEYIAMRMDTGAVALCLALHEYALGIQLPQAIRTDPDMTHIWHQANMIICIINDMLSIKKEIAHGEADSLIPNLVSQGKSPQASMDHAFSIIQNAKLELDTAALRLLAKVAVTHNESVFRDVETYVDSCRIPCRGTTDWSIESGRYRIGVPTLKGGVELLLE